MKHMILVYGTLMKGHCNDHYLREEKYIGIGKLKDYEMYHVAKYPGVVESLGESVVGELYEVSEKTLGRLDQLECEGDLYQRKRLKVILDCNVIEAEVYVWNKPIDTTMQKVVEMPWEPMDKEYCHVQYKELSEDSGFDEANWPILVSDGSGKYYEACTIRGAVAVILGKEYLGNERLNEDWKQRVQYAMKELLSKEHSSHLIIRDYVKGTIAEDFEDADLENSREESVYIESERAFLLSLVKLHKIELYERVGDHYFKDWTDDGNDPTLAKVMSHQTYKDVKEYNLEELLKKTWDEL